MECALPLSLGLGGYPGDESCQGLFQNPASWAESTEQAARLLRQIETAVSAAEMDTGLFTEPVIYFIIGLLLRALLIL